MRGKNRRAIHLQWGNTARHFCSTFPRPAPPAAFPRQPSCWLWARFAAGSRGQKSCVTGRGNKSRSLSCSDNSSALKSWMHSSCCPRHGTAEEFDLCCLRDVNRGGQRRRCHPRLTVCQSPRVQSERFSFEVIAVPLNANDVFTPDFKLYLKANACMSSQPLLSAHVGPLFRLLNQTVLLLLLLSVWVAFLLPRPCDVSQVANDHMWSCDSGNDSAAAVLAALPTSQDSAALFLCGYLLFCVRACVRASDQPLIALIT